MSDLLWDDVKQWFDPVENGIAPDVIVADTTAAIGSSSSWPSPGEGIERPCLARTL